MEKMTREEYNKLAQKAMPGTKSWRTIPCAFVIGGLICLLGQLLLQLYQEFGMEEKLASLLVSITLIFLSALLTGLNIYPKIGKFGGAGSLVPITGFANSVAASAIEFRAEGQVFGIGCKIFTIAGPVILYGIMSSWFLGILYYIFGLLEVAL